MAWIYLSPHLDDAALSCGGLIYEQVFSGEPVTVWTVCAGNPPPGPLSPFAESLHARWETGRRASAARRAEDRRACAALGAAFRHLSIPDCIYRLGQNCEALYTSDEAIMGPLQPQESPLVDKLARQIERAAQQGANIACPLAVGGHVDHRLTRLAAEKTGCRLWYFADYPYILYDEIPAGFLQSSGCREILFPITDEGLEAWKAAISTYASQLSTFWPGLAEMHAAIEKYCREQGGARLWQI